MRRTAGATPGTIWARAFGGARCHIGRKGRHIVGETAVLATGRPPNIGSWADGRDHIKWTVHVDRPGTFRASTDSDLVALLRLRRLPRRRRRLATNEPTE